MVTLDFYYKVTVWSAGTTGTSLVNLGTIDVQYASSTSGPWTTAYTINSSNHTVSTSCVLKTVTFTPQVGNLYIRFNVVSGSGGDNWYYFDDVSVSQGAAPSCLPPSALATGSITSSSASLSWSASPSSPSSNYDIYWSTTNTAPNGTTTPSATNQVSPYTASGLNTSTTYYYWVRANCGGSDTSTWSSGGSFTTACNAYTIPYFEGFESGYTHNTSVSGCLSQESITGTAGWTANTSLTSYNRTPRTGAWNAFLEYSNEDWLYIPIELLAGTSYTVELFARQDGATSTNSNITISYGTNAGVANMTNTIVASTGIVNGNYQKISGSFTPASDGIYYVGIKGYMNGSPWYISLDDISIDVSPSCLPPSALATGSITSSSASLSWSASPSSPSLNYDVYWSTTNTAPDGTTTPSATNQVSPYTASGLNPSTTYYYWVRANCGGGDTSTWVSGGSFTTLCFAATIPTSLETFEGSNSGIPVCWSLSLISGTTNWDIANGSSGDISGAYEGTNFIEKDYNTSDAVLVSMPIDYSAVSAQTRINVFLHRHASAHANDQYKIYVNSVPTLSGATQVLSLYSKTTTSPVVASTGWYNYTVDVPVSFNGQSQVYIIFEGITTAGFSSYDLGIDNFIVENTPTDTPDYVNLQWPPNVTISRGSNFDVYGQVYEGGLTDVEPGYTGQASGIQAWIGISPQGQNTNPNSWTNWVPATWNSGNVSNNDEYMATIGATLPSGTYYYATRFSLNGGPYRYGGIDASNNGNFWDGVTYNSGVLTVNSLPGDNCSVAIDLNTLTSPYNGTTVGGTDESNPTCESNTAPDMHYKIDVPYGYRLNIQQTTNNYDSTNYVFYGDCVTQTSIVCFDDPDYTAVSWLNTTGSTQTVYWINDGYDSDSGTFTLQWSLTEEPCYFTTTWDGSNWSNGVPVANTKAIINGNYTGAGFTACALDILGTSVVTFPAGEVLNIDGLINIAATATFELSNDAYVLQNQNVTNLGTSIVNRDSSPMIRLDYTAWSSPVNGQNLLAFSPNTIANRFYTYDYAGNSWSSVDPSSTSFVPGLGYLIRVANTWSTSVYSPYNGVFSGVLNNGTYNIAAGLGYNLLGNPYPSPIDADAFIADNSSLLTTGALYFWTHAVAQNGSYVTQSNYASYTTAGGVAATAGGTQPDGIIQLGQGFLTNVNTAANIQFNNAQRLGSSNGQFYKATTIEKHRFWLSLSDNSNNFNQMMIAYMTGATNGVDFAIDAKLFTNSPSSLSSIIANENYVIQGRTLTFDPNDEVPLSFIADVDGSYTINLDNFDGLFGSQDIYLWDKTLNVVHDLKLNPYSFSTLAGTYNTRFSVIYSTALSNNDFVIDNSDIIVFDNGQNIEINTNNLMIKNVTIFDIRGRLLYNKNDIQTSIYIINKLERIKQVLVVKIETNEGKFITKKLIF